MIKYRCVPPVRKIESARMAHHRWDILWAAMNERHYIESGDNMIPPPICQACGYVVSGKGFCNEHTTLHYNKQYCQDMGTSTRYTTHCPRFGGVNRPLELLVLSYAPVPSSDTQYRAPCHKHKFGHMAYFDRDPLRNCGQLLQPANHDLLHHRAARTAVRRY